MGLGTRMKEILNQKQMTIKQLSKESGVSVNTLYSITKRDNNMARYDIIEKIATALDVSIEELTGYSIDYNRVQEKTARPGITRLYDVIERDPENKSENGGITAMIRSIVENELQSLGYSFSPIQETILENTEKLNPKGQQKVADYVTDLAGNPEYRIDPDSVMPNVAQNDDANGEDK